MSRLLSKSSSFARQVRLLIAPPTTTTFESRAILSELQSKFGSICTFINQRNDPVLDRLLRSAPKPQTSQPPNIALQTILAVFDSANATKAAVESEPLTISCGGDLHPSPTELDPYNARGMRGRHHPPKRTFTCEIVAEEDDTLHQRLSEENPYYGSWRPDTLHMSFGDLIKAGVETPHMADVMQTGGQQVTSVGKEKWGGLDEKARQMPVGVFYSERDRMRDPEGHGGLMAAWKFGLQKQNNENKSLGAKTLVEKDP